jgi:glutamate-1-semialdehyde 2,1-aminomutase
MMELSKSRKLQALAESVLPSGVNSPVRAFKSVGGVPRFIRKGKGAYLYDADGNRYLDFCCSWGPLILGHADEDVLRAVTEQAALGLTFGATTELEYELARFIVEKTRPIEKIRFVSSGTEAVMSAIRVARGYTGRDLILKFDGCYHGHSDHLLVKAGSGLATFGRPSSAGVPQAITSQTAVLPLDDDESLEAFFDEKGDELAAVIIEGVPANNGLLIQRREYIARLRALTEKHGALLILDEVITGFRLGLGGAAAWYGIEPDLITLGKVIGGGMPVGAFGGRGDVMDCLVPAGKVYQAGTLSGNPVAMAAGLATLEKLADGSIYAQLEKSTAGFVNRLRQLLPEDSLCMPQVGSIFWISFQKTPPRSAGRIDREGIRRYNLIHGPALEAGIYLPPSGYEVCFVSAAHSDQMLLAAAESLADVIARHLQV